MSYVPVPPAETEFAPDVEMGGDERLHGRGDHLHAGGPVGDADDVAFVAHHAAHLEATRPGDVGQAPGVGGVASTAGQAHVHVDDDLDDASGGGGGDRLGRVDRQRDAGAGPRQPAQSAGVDHLVGQEEILAQPGPRHPLHLGDGGAGESPVAVDDLAAGQRRALVGLHVRAQTPTGQGGCHGRQVLLEQPGIHHERRCRQIAGLQPVPLPAITVGGAPGEAARRPGPSVPGGRWRPPD